MLKGSFVCCNAEDGSEWCGHVHHDLREAALCHFEAWLAFPWLTGPDWNRVVRAGTVADLGDGLGPRVLLAPCPGERLEAGLVPLIFSAILAPLGVKFAADDDTTDDEDLEQKRAMVAALRRSIESGDRITPVTTRRSRRARSSTSSTSVAV